MLLYNHKKELIGVDNKLLETLGLQNIQELLEQTQDFADLFVKEPGYVHNFKHVHWIDYLCVAEDGEMPKVMIELQQTRYTAQMEVQNIYLTDAPTQKGFVVNLFNLRPVDADIDTNKNDTEEKKQEETKNETPLDLGESVMQEPSVDEQPATQTETSDEHDVKKVLDGTYVYDPRIASEELGLPIDLIEEFIQDFIVQAKEFQPQLNEALEHKDIDRVKILSHKLKGVAANLRIEDALEVLATINSTSDLDEITQHLSLFYSIISKLDKNEDTQPFAQEEDETEKETSEDELTLEFKEDEHQENLSIDDEDVPEQIEIAELADDNFILQEDTTQIDIDEDGLLEDELLLLDEQEDLHYSSEDAAKDIGLDQESFSQLLHEYTSEAQQIVEQMKTLLQEQEIESLHQKALQLKGMSDNMRLSQISATLDEMILSKETHALASLLNKVEGYLKQVL